MRGSLAKVLSRVKKEGISEQAHVRIIPSISDKTMTTKELSTILNVGESTVKRTVEKLRPVLGVVSLNTQGGFLFNEEQATLIKQEIQKQLNIFEHLVCKIFFFYVRK